MKIQAQCRPPCLSLLTQIARLGRRFTNSQIDEIKLSPVTKTKIVTKTATISEARNAHQ